jgi:hypothetical protein
LTHFLNREKIATLVSEDCYLLDHLSVGFLLGEHMRKTGHQAIGFADGAVWHSLSAIKQAHDQLHLLTRMRTSTTVLASQIELCEVLLVEISDIRRSLASDLQQTRGSHCSGILQ